MRVIDLIIQLQKQDPNREVLLDITGENSKMFKFHEIVSVEEITDSLDQTYVVISPFEYSE